MSSINEPDGPDTDVLLIRIDDWTGALQLDAVGEVLPAVAITRLSGMPGGVLGHVDVHGELVEVIDARRRLGFEPRDLESADRMVLLTEPARVIVPVDEALGLARVRPMPRIRVADGPPGSTDRGSAATGLHPARIDGEDGRIVALIDPEAAFGPFGKPVAERTAGAPAAEH